MEAQVVADHITGFSADFDAAAQAFDFSSTFACAVQQIQNHTTCLIGVYNGTATNHNFLVVLAKGTSSSSWRLAVRRRAWQLSTVTPWLRMPRAITLV
jgi:hypothetical protein